MQEFKASFLVSLFLLTLFWCGFSNAGQLENHTNSTGMKFVRVPSGTFLMGENPPLSEGKGDERPAHEVTLSKPFYIGIH